MITARPTAAALCVTALLASSAAAPLDTPEVSELVGRAHDALGWERVAAHPGAVRVRGAASLLGTDADQTDVFDGRGRWLQTFEGPLPGAGGTDGQTSWAVDWTGTPRVLELGDAHYAQIQATLLYGSWARPESAIEFTSADRERDLWLLEFRLEGGYVTGVVRLDEETLLPRSIRWETPNRSSTWTFRDWQDHSGFRFPGHVSLEEFGLVQTLETRSVEFLESVDEDLFRPRLERPQDFRFDPQVAAELQLMRAPTGHLLVRPAIDGADLGWFIFDTGAGAHCLSSAVAQRVAGEPFGAVPALGIGGSVTSHFRSARELRLGPLTIDAPVFIELDLGFLSQSFGVEIAGIIGYELLARCAVEFDPDTPRISLFDSEHYELPERESWRDLLLLDRQPCVRASLEGREGLFMIDTGAPGRALVLHATAVRELALLEGRATTASSRAGVGGSVPMRRGELATFEFGGHEFGAIQALFATRDSGSFGDGYVWGDIGAGLLRPFVIVFDYPHRRLSCVKK